MVKRILITGKDSYIGTYFENWLKSYYPNKYIIDTVSTFNNEWEKINFSTYDVVFHVAGIAHVDTPSKKSSSYEKMKSLYYKVNRDLTIQVANKAKKQGVKQFIFMSSIIVYGENSDINEKKVISIQTMPNPTNFYGKSKLEAEEGILPMQSENFQVAVLRPPMIYGKGSKGNYIKLSKLARKSPIFPEFNNSRSMLHVDNLCEFIRLLINDEAHGIFYPQNLEYVNTTDLVETIAKSHGRKILTLRTFNPVILLLGKKMKVVNKVFGTLVYEKEMSKYVGHNYCIRDMKQSIEVTEE